MYFFFSSLHIQLHDLCVCFIFADYAVFVTEFKKIFSIPDVRVVVLGGGYGGSYGGSYGDILAPACRIHYPSIFNLTKEFIECADQTGCRLKHDVISCDYQMCTDIVHQVNTNNISDTFCTKNWKYKI